MYREEILVKCFKCKKKFTTMIRGGLTQCQHCGQGNNIPRQLPECSYCGQLFYYPDRKHPLKEEPCSFRCSITQIYYLWIAVGLVVGLFGPFLIHWVRSQNTMLYILLNGWELGCLVGGAVGIIVGITGAMLRLKER